MREKYSNHSAAQMGSEARLGHLAISDHLWKHGRSLVIVTPVARTKACEFVGGNELFHKMSTDKW